MQKYSSCVWRLHPHRESDDFLIEEIAPQSGVDHERRTVDAAAAFAQKKERRVGDLLGFEIAFPKRKLLRVEIALQIPGYSRGRTGLERARSDHVESHS